MKDGEPTTDAARILIVEDNAAMARCLTGIAKHFGSVTVEATLLGALQQLDTRTPWSAFVVDLNLPDGCGLEVISRIRANDRNIPALILTGDGEHDTINAAFDLRAQYLCKPATRTQMERFLGSAIEHPLAGTLPQSAAKILVRNPESLIADRVRKLARSCNLTALETDLVDACLHGFSRKEYVQANNVSLNTYKKRVRRALRKLGASSLDAVRDCLLRAR
jgi:DNA-binding NarL/FixJ family response regulator